MAKKKQIAKNDITGDRGIAFIHRVVSDMAHLWTPKGLEAGIDGFIELEASPGYFVEPEVEQEMLECLREVLLVETDKAKVLPFSQADNAKLGKRVSNHPLHETFLGNQLNDASIRDEYYRESRKGSLLAELDTAGDVDRSKPLKRLQRVYTAPVKDLLEEWRERAAELRRQEHPRNPRDE